VSFRGASFELGHLAEAWTAAVVLGVHQGCPNAVLEAMSASIPVIANASGGTADILDAGRAGWLLPAEANAAAVAKAMADILAHPAEAHERARRGRDRVLARHSMEEMARSYLDVLAAAEAGGREKMDAWTSASALPAQDRSPSAPFPAATP
jgi:glycosyltransferase involved in cell wall biosynthesis